MWKTEVRQREWGGVGRRGRDMRMEESAEEENYYGGRDRTEEGKVEGIKKQRVRERERRE